MRPRSGRDADRLEAASGVVVRALSRLEKDRAAGLAAVPHVTVGLIEVTETQLKKSIIDANDSIRRALGIAGIHDFASQPQGPDHKAVIDVERFEGGEPRRGAMSLYRPVTKQGDPRLWIYGATEWLVPGEIVALACTDDRVFVVSLADADFDEALYYITDELLYEGDVSSIASELLEKLRRIAASGPVASPRSGDTAIGAALEAALGIAQNSSKAPDYKGIELKSKRRAANVRSSLFACVPDWSMSPCKSSAEILDRYGYERDGIRRLYCQVNAGHANSQGLRLRIDHDIAMMTEVHGNGRGPVSDVAIWPLQRLESRLLAKHRETFWVTASTSWVDGREYFQLHEVEHTREPQAAALAFLIDDDVVSMDHLIKRDAKGSVTEKGPLFKMDRSQLAMLFPTVLKHTLL